MDFFMLVLFSFIGGIAGGMGMGGGTLLIPLLTVFCGVSQISAQSLNLLSFVPMSVVAFIMHAKNKLIEYKYLLLSIPALISSVIASLLAYGLPMMYLKMGFGVFLAVLGMINLVSVFLKKSAEQLPEKNEDK